LAALDEHGKSMVINYNVPEPTSYPGAALIDLAVDPAFFVHDAKTARPREQRTGTDQLTAVSAEVVVGALAVAPVSPLFPHVADFLNLPQAVVHHASERGPDMPLARPLPEGSTRRLTLLRIAT
jgi:hypothetical protein